MLIEQICEENLKVHIGQTKNFVCTRLCLVREPGSLASYFSDQTLFVHTVTLTLVRTQIFCNRFFLSGNQFLSTAQSRVTGNWDETVGQKIGF